jgi:hypothetical protein
MGASKEREYYRGSCSPLSDTEAMKMYACRYRMMITPYKVNQRRISENDAEINFEAICEPSGNDNMAARKAPPKYPQITLSHLALAQEESCPNTGKSGNHGGVLFPCNKSRGRTGMLSKRFS